MSFPLQSLSWLHAFAKMNGDERISHSGEQSLHYTIQYNAIATHDEFTKIEQKQKKLIGDNETHH